MTPLPRNPEKSIGSNAIYIGGSEALKKKYLPDLTSGKKIGAFALTEVLAGSDSFNLRTRAHREGDETVLEARDDEAPVDAAGSLREEGYLMDVVAFPGNASYCLPRKTAADHDHSSNDV